MTPARRWGAQAAGMVAATVALGACATFDAPADPSGGVPDVLVADPSFERNIQPIFTKRCAIGGCHTFASHQVGLVLQAPFAYDSIVNVESRLHRGMQRVRPFDADQSWLVRMISDDPSRRDNFPRMPLASQPLTPNQIGTIVNWVEEGAPRN